MCYFSCVGKVTPNVLRGKEKKLCTTGGDSGSWHPDSQCCHRLFLRLSVSLTPWEPSASRLSSCLFWWNKGLISLGSAVAWTLAESRRAPCQVTGWAQGACICPETSTGRGSPRTGSILCTEGEPWAPRPTLHSARAETWWGHTALPLVPAGPSCASSPACRPNAGGDYSDTCVFSKTN